MRGGGNFEMVVRKKERKKRLDANNQGKYFGYKEK